MSVTLGNNSISGAASILGQGANAGILQNSNGIVNFPYVPVFQAYGTADGTYADENEVHWGSVEVNVGSHYDPSTGRFTAPVAGDYIFYCSTIGSSSNDVYRYFFRRNGTNLGNGRHLRLDNTSTGSEYATNFANSIMVSLSVNDYVSVYFSSDSGNSTYPGSNSSTHYSYFSGYLVI